MPLSPRSKNLLSGAAVILVVFLAYIPALRSSFVWDDNIILWNNPLIASPSGLFSFWFTTLPPDYFPLSSSMLWFEWRIFGTDDIWGYHAVTILLHACSSLVLWRLLLRLQIPGALFAALLFALHPVNVEAVAWIAQRKTTLSLVFALLSALMFFKSRETEATVNVRSPWRLPRYRLALFFFLLGLLAKTSVAMLPVALLALTWWRFGPITRRDVSRVVPFFVLAAALSLVTIWFQYNVSIAGDVVRDDSFFSRLAISGWAVWFYIYKALLPLNLIFIYPRWNPEIANPLTWLPLLFLSLAVYGLWRIRTRPWARAVLTALVVYVAMLFPILGFFDIYFMRYSLVADHWQYPALPALIALLSASLASLVHRARRQAVVRCIACLVLAALATLTWKQSRNYTDEATLWNHTLANNPGAWCAHENLGILFSANDRLEEAAHHFRITLLLAPDRAEAHNNLAASLRDPSQVEEALHHYKRAIELDPTLPASWFNAGNILLKGGQLDTAIAYYRRAINLDPDYANAHANLGSALARKGLGVEAIAHFRKALQVNPGLVATRFNLANTLANQGSMGEAIHQFNAALDAQPEELNTLTRLAWILATSPVDSLRDGNRAFRLAVHAQRLAKNSPEVARTLAAALAEIGRMDDAVNVAREAINFATAANNAALADRIRAELALYEQGSPARDGQTVTPRPPAAP